MPYVFRVAAENSAGVGAYSAWTAPVTPYSVPSAPGNLQGTAGDARVTLSWNAPSNNGSPLTGYFIDYGPTGTGQRTTAPANATSAVITGLTNGTSYRFTVWATNAAGNGPFARTASLTPVAALQVPGVPTSLAGTPGMGQVDLRWSAPASTGGSPITDYAVQYSSNAGANWTAFARSPSSATAATVTGLSNGVGYVFRVAAINSVGTSEFTAASAVFTPSVPTSPGAPSNVTGTPGNSSVALQWTAPSSDGGSVISDYSVQYSSDGGSSWTTFTRAPSTAASVNVTGLANGTTYLFRVAATNAVGLGSFSNPSAGIIPVATVTAPGSPTRVTATWGNASVTVSWTAPVGGSAATGYAVQYSTDSGTTWTAATTVSANASQATISGLTNGVSYWTRVGAVNSAGTTFSSMTVPVIPLVSPFTNQLWRNSSPNYAIAVWTRVDQYGVGLGAPVVINPGRSATPTAFTGGSKTLYVAIASSTNLNPNWYTVVNPNLRVTVADVAQLTFWVDGWVGSSWQIRVNNTRSVPMYPSA